MTLKSGGVLLAYNNMSGETKGDLRNILALSLSEDAGETFAFTRLLESHSAPPSATTASSRAGSKEQGVGPTSCDCYSYPSLAQSEHDASIYVAYTYQRRTIKVSRVSEAWVRAVDGPLCQ